MGSEKIVLVVEDDAPTRDALASVIEDLGYPVKKAENGHDALNELRRGGPLPSLILLDLMMPMMDGWQFLKELNADPSLTGIPVVITSALPNPPEGTAAILRKPVHLDDLLAVLKKYC